MRSDPRRGGVERATRIIAAEHRLIVLLRAGIAQDSQVGVAALQHGDRRIQHHRRIDLALLHRRDRGRAEADADHGDARSASTPFFFNRYLRKKSVEEPGALTPTFLPARSLIDLISALWLGDTTSTKPG